MDTLYVGDITLGVTFTSRCLWIKGPNGEVQGNVYGQTDSTPECILIEGRGVRGNVEMGNNGDNTIYMAGAVDGRVFGGTNNVDHLIGTSGGSATYLRVFSGAGMD